MAAPEIDVNAALLASVTATGAEAQEAESRWSSTSSAEADESELELDNFWHDSTTLNHFYTTQDTVHSLDSFGFNNDNLFFGPFDSCSTSTSQYRTQDSISHVTETSAVGIESIDFANTQMTPAIPDFQEPTTILDGPLDLSSWTIPLLNGEDSTSTLKDKLNNALTRGDGGRLFVPDDALMSILSLQSVSTELQSHLPTMSSHELQRLAGQITTGGFLRTFATLVLLDKTDCIVDLLQEGIADSAFPLMKARPANASPKEPTFELRRKDLPGVQLRCFKSWSQADIDTFEKSQWRVLSPVFSDIAKEQEVDFFDLEDQTILPYIESWENKKHDHYKGGNSEVWKVKIHDGHHNFQNHNTVVPNNPYFAIKKLKSKDDEAFRREVQNLQRLHNAEHPNLLSLLATYKYRGYYHLVFPWADGDLRRLWQSTPNPQAGKEEMRWLASQCASIASALKSVHAGAESWMNSNSPGGGNVPNGQQRMVMNKFGIHGDIKPENIFIFSKGQQKSFKALAMGPPNRTTDSTTPSDRSSRSGSPSSIVDEFVIGDFGGGAFYDPSTHPDPLRQITVTYRPPEYDTKLRPVSRAWDIWGLGCTYLEFVTWFLLGPSGLTEFAKRRTTRTAAGKLSDAYFDTFIDGSQTGGIGATLKESVLVWIGELYRHKNSSQYIRDFLDFITHRMFIVENISLVRASGEEVAEHMNELTRKCFDDDIYCLPCSKATPSWDVQSISTDSCITALSSTTPDDFNLDFGNAITEDVSSSPAWHFSSVDNDIPLGQWNTAPIMPAGSPTFLSMNCADMLGSWNYTAPVVWDHNNGTNQSIGSEKKRKREIEDVTDALERRVSPKTSSVSPTSNVSPETTSGSSTAQSPVVETHKQKAERRFACPYYKNNPGKFRQKRTCCGPGWPTVHRVKEHLYRCHTIGKHTCSRCLKRCKSATELLAHQRAEIPCNTTTDAFPEGTMLPSQEEALRVKKRVPPNTMEEDRWNEVYMVLFPDTDATALPSPFYEDEPAETRQTIEQSSKLEDSTASGEWFCTPSDYEQYLTRSLPARVQRELERQVQQEFGSVGDGQQARLVVDMVQKLQLKLFKQFEQERRNMGSGQSGAG